MRPSANRHVLSQLRRIIDPKGMTMTQERLAEKVGCGKETIRKIEKDKLNLSRALAERIFLATGIAPEWLLENDKDAPPIEGVTGKPYTKDVYERIQAKRGVEGSESQGHRHRLSESLERTLWAFTAAEKTSVEAAALLAYRFLRFAEQSVNEFGKERFSYSKKGQERWDALHHELRSYLHEANPLPVKLADGTEALLHPEEPYESAKPVNRKGTSTGKPAASRPQPKAKGGSKRKAG